MREGGRTGSGGGHRVRAALVVAEVALAVVLLTGAGLLIRSFVKLTRVTPGFQPEHAMAVRVTLQGEAYAHGEQIRNRVEQFEERLRSLPGVTAVAATSVLPLSGLGSLLSFSVEGASPPPPDVNPEIAVASVTPGYFRAIGAPIRRGRGFTDRDDSEAPPVAVINEAAVCRWFPNEYPIGRRVDIGSVREVGVVANVLQRNPGAIRSEIRALDPDLAIAEFTPLDQLVARSVARPRFYPALLALFAAVALALAAKGIFGVMSYTVAQRTREIGIRMALGAHAGDVLRLIVGRAVALAALGLVAGILIALPLGRYIESQLFGVAVLDVFTLAVVALVLGASAAAASFLPARRAASLDPGSALREV